LGVLGAGVGTWIPLVPRQFDVVGAATAEEDSPLEEPLTGGLPGEGGAGTDPLVLGVLLRGGCAKCQMCHLARGLAQGLRLRVPGWGLSAGLRG